MDYTKPSPGDAESLEYKADAGLTEAGIIWRGHYRCSWGQRSIETRIRLGSLQILRGNYLFTYLVCEEGLSRSDTGKAIGGEGREGKEFLDNKKNATERTLSSVSFRDHCPILLHDLDLASSYRLPPQSSLDILPTIILKPITEMLPEVWGQFLFIVCL